MLTQKLKRRNLKPRKQGTGENSQRAEHRRRAKAKKVKDLKRQAKKKFIYNFPFHIVDSLGH
jgi:hypothetical protein